MISRNLWQHFASTLVEHFFIFYHHSIALIHTCGPFSFSSVAVYQFQSGRRNTPHVLAEWRKQTPETKWLSEESFCKVGFEEIRTGFLNFRKAVAVWYRKIYGDTLVSTLVEHFFHFPDSQYSTYPHLWAFFVFQFRGIPIFNWGAAIHPIFQRNGVNSHPKPNGFQKNPSVRSVLKKSAPDS